MVLNLQQGRSAGLAGGIVDSALAQGRIHIALVDYGPTAFVENENATVSDCLASLDDPDNTWIHVTGKPDASLLDALGQAFGLHPLALEDVLKAGQRPKLDPYEGQLFTVLSYPSFSPAGVDVSQVSIFLGEHFVVSFQEMQNDVFSSVRRRLASPVSKMRSRGADFLFYALVDVVVDHKFPVLEEIGEAIEELDSELLTSPEPHSLERIHRMKRDLLVLRRFLWPEREVMSRLCWEDTPLIAAETKLYLRDCHDHAVKIIDLLENYREMANAQVDIYLSSTSKRLNEVMRLLTVISTIFMPLTFLTSLYGMNFDRSKGPLAMPELGWAWGYPALWVIMIGIVAVMILWFRKRHWL